jgi:hypothetical protein
MKTIKRIPDSCNACVEAKIERGLRKAKIGICLRPTQKADVLSLDFLGPYKTGRLTVY